MINKEVMDEYEPTVGIECHVQLKTATKLFSGVGNDARGVEPNVLVSPICFGLPGVLPVLNQEALELAIRAGITLNAEIAKETKFDRKHYFYPDLPKGYQITQYDQPIVGKGHVDITVGDEKVRVGITRAHLEEDAGKSIHPPGKDYTLVDLNRAGTPLLEIVSEPDIHSAAAAKAYVQELYYLMKYADVSDVDLYQGNMRFDVNISVSKKGGSQRGTRTEVKNLNSFKSVEKAVEYEFKRQVELLEKGKSITQETRGWDDSKMRTFSQRGKEEAHDYRYFPEPDIPPVVITPQLIEKIKQAMPKLPEQIRSELKAAGVDAKTGETLLEYPRLLDKLFAEQSAGAEGKHLKRITDWLSNVVISAIQKQPDLLDDENFLKYPGNLLKLSQMIEDDKISSTSAKTILTAHMTDFYDPEIIADEMGLIQESDVKTLKVTINEVIKVNEKAVADIRKGEKKATGHLIGEVMKKSKGKANPQIVRKIIEDTLKENETS